MIRHLKVFMCMDYSSKVGKITGSFFLIQIIPSNLTINKSFCHLSIHLWFWRRCIAGSSKWQTYWVKAKSAVRANASYLYLCHKYDGWKRSATIWMSNLSKAAAYRSKVCGIHWFWNRFQSKALDIERRCFAMWH